MSYTLRLEYGGMRFENDVTDIADVVPARDAMTERHGIEKLKVQHDGSITGRTMLTGQKATFRLI